MKIRFIPDLDFQLDAVDAVCSLFRGQETSKSEFTVTRNPAELQAQIQDWDDIGTGNLLRLPDEELHRNLNSIQRRNGVAPSESLGSCDFTVEMETGTGKTYVYLRTIFELNRRYGFTKFIVVVPSIAIKEGVYKTLQITEDHFRALYSGTPCDYFLYDSAKLGQVRNFATSSLVHIMVVTVGAINKPKVNNLYKESEKTGGKKPIDVIRATRPIVIVDEPQSVDGGLTGGGRKALDRMNPLCTLRYSATHVDQYHMVYRLDAVDAYERKLVKQIEVASATVEDAYNRPYVHLVSTQTGLGAISATVELDLETPGGVRRKRTTVYDGDDLHQVSHRAIYSGCEIGQIRVERGREFMELRLPGNAVFLRPGEAHGDVDSLAVERAMIRRTIIEHLGKERRLRPQGIKVLSLFFVDIVSRYRRYEKGSPVKGDYALLFEEEYRRLAKHPDYCEMFKGLDAADAAAGAHEGYFSIDKKGGWVDTAENNENDRQSSERAYNLIMKDKETLLSLDTPLRFIFSHSALSEGWDNPNVFQICALRDIRSDLARRQTIGRGLRLCVNHRGERVPGFEVNTLTVVARESYEEFAEGLQREIETDTGLRFGIVEPHLFASISICGDEGGPDVLGFDASRKIWEHLRTERFVDSEGRVRASLRHALAAETLTVPERFAAQRDEIARLLKKFAGGLRIKNADERRAVRPRQAVLNSPEFRELWDRIKHRTIYRVEFNNQELIDECTRAVKDAPHIPRPRLRWRKADIAIGHAGVEATETATSGPVTLRVEAVPLPDVLTELQDKTQLTRRSISHILSESGRLEDFRRNPQQFIELAAQTIDRCKRAALVGGIKYKRLGEEFYYAQELFEDEELTGYLRNILQGTKKSIYESVVYESETERRFADSLEKNTDVKVYAKLPGWFEVPTPLGSYNPDWAVVIDTYVGLRLYFVAETKGSTVVEDLRGIEQAKIKCGEAHFRALEVREPPARFKVVSSAEDLY